MTHFGIISAGASTSHLNAILPLGQALKRRGHQVTFFGVVDAEPKVTKAGIAFYPIGQTELLPGSAEAGAKQLGQLKGLAALKFTIETFERHCRVNLQEMPAAMRMAQVEALLIDQSAIEGGTIAEILKVPFITVCSAVMLNQEASIPPPFTSWQYRSSAWAQIRNRIGYRLLDQALMSIHSVIQHYRDLHHLPRYVHDRDFYSSLAQLSQAPAEFEFPRQELPSWFHFTGAYYTASSRTVVPFPDEQLTGQPLIYASLGTVMNRAIEIFRAIATACAAFDVQLVLSLGSSIQREKLPHLPGNPIVVEYAPQLELLQKAALMITHAGMSSTLESLQAGVPMVAIPMVNDQPGIAARIAWTGAGEVVPLRQLTVPKLQTAIQKVLTQPSYQQNALRLQAAMQRSGGIDRAVEVIEQAVTTGKPVSRHAFDDSAQRC